MEEINKKFLDLYNLYSNDVLRLAFSFTKNIFESEDIVQSVFIKLYQKLKKDYDKDIGKKWLLKVTSNECKNSFKIVWRKKVVLQNEVKEIFSNLNEVGSDNEIYGKEIELENLNTTAYYYWPFGSRNGRCKVYTYVVIVYDNVIYTFNTQGVSLDNIIKDIK